MRNLKKFLALVLAMMMVFSLFVTVHAADTVEVAPGRTSFTDAADFTPDYYVAADALTGMGIMSGYDDGTFLPGKVVTRPEFTAFLYRIHSGDVEDKNIANYTSYAAVFTDVGTSKWYSGYVGYCVKEGLIVGQSETEFGKDKDIEAVDALVSVLRALGYDETKELQGSGYRARAVAEAKDAELVEERSSLLDDIRGTVTREIVAQICWNALNANMVFWNAEKGKYDPDNITLGLSSFTMTPASDAKIAAANTVKDIYGRPGIEAGVMVNGKLIVTEREADLLTTFKTKMTLDNVKKALGADTEFEAGLKAHVDGAEGFADADSFAKLANLTSANSVVEVYTDGSKISYVVVIREHVTVLKSGDIKAATSKVKAHIVLDTGITYDTEDYAKDDVVVYTYGTDAKGNKVVDTITKVEDTVTGKLDKITGSTAKTYVIGGTGYPASDVVDGATPPSSGIGEEYTVWLHNGAIVHAKAVKAPAAPAGTNYIYALHDDAVTYEDGDGGFITLSKVTGIDKNGKLITLPVSQFGTDAVGSGVYATAGQVIDKTGATASVIDTDNDAYSGTANRKVYTYVEDEDNPGKYILTAAATGDKMAVETGTINKTSTASHTFTINSTSTQLKSSLYANNNTKYFVAVYDRTAKKYNDVIIYNGYSTVGNITTDAAAYLEDTAAGLNDSRTTIAVTVIDEGKDNIADYVFIDSYTAAATPAKEYAYVLSEGEQTDTNKFVYPAIIDGEETELVLTSEISSAVTFPALLEVTTVGKTVTAATPSAADGNYTTTDTVIKRNSGTSVITFTYNAGSLMKKVGTGTAARVGDIDATVPVYLFEEGALADKTTAKDMGSINAPTIIISVAKGEIAAIYAVLDGETAIAGTGGAAAEVSGQKNADSLGAGDKLEVKDDGQLNVAGNVESGANVGVKGGEMNVEGSLKGGSTVEVSDGGELNVTGDLEAGAKVKTDDIGSVHVDGDCKDSIEYTGEELTPDDWAEVEEGMSFVMDGGTVGSKKDSEDPISIPERTEYCFVFKTDTHVDKITVTITGMTGTMAGHKWVQTYDGTGQNPAKLSASTKYKELVCPAQLNDGSTFQTSNSRYEYFSDGNVNGTGTKLTKTDSAAGNTLAVGYYTIEIKDNEGHILFTGGFTVTSETNQLHPVEDN